MGLSLSKNGGIFFYFIHMRPPWKIFTGSTGRGYVLWILVNSVIPEGISKHVHAAKYLIAVGVAGATSHTVTAPLDLLKVILQVLIARVSIDFTVREIWKAGGVLSFFRGNGINVMNIRVNSENERIYTTFARECSKVGKLRFGGRRDEIIVIAAHLLPL
ncbi:hypothetical protein FXO37_22351 [Capsicum annuum]|nr:hypothetical protein FXO37_22351 [Capsicum annuum]